MVHQPLGVVESGAHEEGADMATREGRDDPADRQPIWFKSLTELRDAIQYHRVTPRTCASGISERAHGRRRLVAASAFLVLCVTAVVVVALARDDVTDARLELASKVGPLPSINYVSCAHAVRFAYSLEDV